MPESAPFPTEFQEHILHWLWKTRRGLLNFGGGQLSPAFFDDGQLGQLWSLISSHWKANRTAPSLGVVMELIRRTYPGTSGRDEDARNSTSERARSIYGGDFPDDPYVEQRIRDFIGWCAVKEVIIDELEAIQGGRYNPQLVAKVQAAVRAGQNDLDLGWSAKEDAVKAIVRYADPDINPPIPTGMMHLDAVMGGGLRRRELGMVMAPPKGKKSAFLMNVACNGPTLGTRVNVLYVTLELTEELQALRFAIRTTQRDKHMMMLDLERYLALYRRRAASVYSPAHNVYFKFFPPYACTPDKIRAYIDVLQQEKGIVVDLLCVDYLELMGSDAVMEKDYMTQVRIITALRQIGVDYDMAVWTASRTNAQAEAAISSGKWITAQHTSGSYEKQGVVDASFGMQRYRGTDLAIVPVAFRNEAGGKKVHVKADMARMTLTTVGFIEDNEAPDNEDEEEDGGRKFRGGGGKKKFIPRGTVSFGKQN